jgi:hypothetical protein
LSEDERQPDGGSAERSPTDGEAVLAVADTTTEFDLRMT